MAIWTKKKDRANKTELLSQYTRGQGPVKFRTEIPPDAAIPAWWRDLSALTRRGRVTLALSHWEATGPLVIELSKTISYLRTYCKDVEVMCVASTYYLLYSIKNRSENMRYCVGGNPLTAQMNESVSRLWPLVPASIRSFYRLHDGFYDYVSASGINPSARMSCLGDEDWGILDNLGSDVQIDLSSTIAVVGNGAGECLAVDVSDCEAGKAVLWSSKDPPRYDLIFWDVADDWMIIFLDGI